MLAVAVAVSAARRWTRAPERLAIAAISSSSVDTHTSANTPLASAGWMTQSMSGRPARSLIFFLGMDTEPPRAGMTATTRGGGVERTDELVGGAARTAGRTLTSEGS